MDKALDKQGRMSQAGFDQFCANEKYIVAKVGDKLKWGGAELVVQSIGKGGFLCLRPVAGSRVLGPSEAIGRYAGAMKAASIAAKLEDCDARP